MSKITKNLKDVLGKEKIDEIIEKEWKVAELPSDEEIKNTKSVSPKARNNPNSRKNLVQYNKKRSAKSKKAAVNNLKVTEKQEDVIPFQVLGSRAKADLIEKIMPATKILVDRDEQLIYYNTIKMYLNDFSSEELSFSDLDDVITLAINRVLEQRLLALCLSDGGQGRKLLDAAPALEKFRKHSDKLKQNLATRRVDRIDLKNKPSMSIVELADHLDVLEKSDFEARLIKLNKENEEYVPPPRDDKGNII